MPAASKLSWVLLGACACAWITGSRLASSQSCSQRLRVLAAYATGVAWRMPTSSVKQGSARAPDIACAVVCLLGVEHGGNGDGAVGLGAAIGPPP